MMIRVQASDFGEIKLCADFKNDSDANIWIENQAFGPEITVTKIVMPDNWKELKHESIKKLKGYDKSKISPKDVADVLEDILVAMGVK